MDESYKGSGVALWMAYEKYGMDNFTTTILEECDDAKLNELECKYIKEYNTLSPNGYNITKGGGFYDTISHNPNKEDIIRRSAEGNRRYNQEHPDRLKGENNPMYGKGYLIAGENNPMYGKHHTEENKKKISEASKSKWKDPEYRLKQTGENASCYGRCGDKHPMYGKHHTEEAKKRISKAQKGVPKRNETILQIDLTTNEIIKEWPNALEIEKEIGYKSHTITTVALTGTTECKTAYGYRWLWKSDYNMMIEHGLPLPPFHKKGERNKKPVLQIDINTGEIIKEWASAADIKNELGYSNTSILNCCKGKYKTSYNYIWRYKYE